MQQISLRLLWGHVLVFILFNTVIVGICNTHMTVVGYSESFWLCKWVFTAFYHWNKCSILPKNLNTLINNFTHQDVLTIASNPQWLFQLQLSCTRAAKFMSYSAIMIENIYTVTIRIGNYNAVIITNGNTTWAVNVSYVTEKFTCSVYLTQALLTFVRYYKFIMRVYCYMTCIPYVTRGVFM